MASAKFKMIQVLYDKKFWDADMVRDAVKKGWITEEEKKKILKERDE
jgi:hypothetical protein